METGKDITINELAGLMTSGFAEADRKNEELAAMVANGFAELKEEISSVRTELKEEISSVRTELKQDIAVAVENLTANMNRRFDEVNAEIHDLRAEVDRLSLRTKEDADAMAADILKINERLDELESKVQALQPA